jgi:hypothetical protein
MIMCGLRRRTLMLIKRKSQLTGKTHELDLPVTEDQIKLWQEGVFAQHAFPNLSPAQREFIMTGITGEEWDEVFGE